jgi:uncharacterized damage-inducible protein DinB
LEIASRLFAGCVYEEMRMSENKTSLPEPWLRGTLAEVPAVARGVLHALELAREDANKWCGGLNDTQIHARPAGLPSVAFQLRHITGSLDRLLTYGEGRALSKEQLQALKAEARPEGSTKEVLAELEAAISSGSLRVRALASEDLTLPRAVGTKRLPTTLGGLLVHIAEHTQRHVGQAITTAKLVSASKAF